MIATRKWPFGRFFNNKIGVSKLNPCKSLGKFYLSWQKLKSLLGANGLMITLMRSSESTSPAIPNSSNQPQFSVNWIKFPHQIACWTMLKYCVGLFHPCLLTPSQIKNMPASHLFPNKASTWFSTKRNFLLFHAPNQGSPVPPPLFSKLFSLPTPSPWTNHNHPLQELPHKTP